MTYNLLVTLLIGSLTFGNTLKTKIKKIKTSVKTKLSLKHSVDNHRVYSTVETLNI